MKLINQTEYQRFYQLDFKIFRYGNDKTIRDLFFKEPPKFNDGYELAEDIVEYIDKICVSDAHTHIERICFPAFNVRNIKTGDIFVSHRVEAICGCWTLLTHGGDRNAVYPDAVYIRKLRMWNR